MSDIIPITRPSVGNPTATQPRSEVPKYPSEIITLPSTGYFYADGNPLASGQVELKQISSREEDILSSPNLIKKGIVLDKLLESVVLDKKIDLNSMLIVDRDSILYSIRRLAYGEKYIVSMNCPSCGKDNSEVNIDLSTMEYKEIDFNKYTKGENSFPFDLPYSKANITYKLLTRGDELLIDKEIEAFKKINKDVSTEISTRLNYIITSVNGESDKATIRKFVANQLTTRDSLVLRMHIKNMTPRLDTTFEFTCEHCQYQKNQEVPMGLSFFWPNQ